MELPKKIILKQFQSPGDVLMMTVLAARLKKAYPDIQIRVHTCADEYFENNPNIKVSDIPSLLMDSSAGDGFEDGGEWKEVITHYSDDPQFGKAVDNKWSINRCGTTKGHFTQGFIGYFNSLFGIALPDYPGKPELYLTDAEKKPVEGLPEKYWIVLCGGKSDYLRKIYPTPRWKRLFELMPGTTFVQLGIKAAQHMHPTFDLPNVVNYMDKTSLRQMAQLIYNSQGVVSPITQSIVIAAALNKPCIVLAGGGEHVTWQAYRDNKRFHYLHTCNVSFSYNKLPQEIKEQVKEEDIKNPNCCRSGGCWGKNCSNIMPDGEQLCMKFIAPEFIAEIIRKY